MQASSQFNPGFRLSVLDCIVILFGAVGACLAYRIEASLGIAIAFTVGHFFLFCNIVRMARPKELVWAVAFVLLASASALSGTPAWSQTFVASFAITCFLVVLELRSPSYHGVLWQKINPKLRDWWQTHQGILS